MMRKKKTSPLLLLRKVVHMNLVGNEWKIELALVFRVDAQESERSEDAFGQFSYAAQS